MPLSRYFKGKGSEVMANMEKEYGPEKAKRVFYATANARGMKPEGGHLAKAFAKAAAKRRKK